MENLRITLELTLEEARFVLSKLWQFRAAKEEANKQQPQPDHKPLVIEDWGGYKSLEGEIIVNSIENKEPFKLQYGKRYKRRDGETTKPLMSCDSITYPFTDGNEGWTPRGFYYKTEEPHPYDLIEEA